MKHTKRILALVLVLLLSFETLAVFAAYDSHDEADRASQVLDLTNSVFVNNEDSASASDNHNVVGDFEADLEERHPDADLAEVIAHEEAMAAAENVEPRAARAERGVLASWSFPFNSSVNEARLDNNHAVVASSSMRELAPVIRFHANDAARQLNGASSGINVMNPTGSGSGLHDSAENAWWHTTINTTGLTNLEISWAMRSTATGPRDFRLEYRVEGSDQWIVVTDIIVPSAGQLTDDANQFSAVLPAQVENQESVHLRWIVASNQRAGAPHAQTGDTTIAEGGTHQINHIVIAYDKIPEHPAERSSIALARETVGTGTQVTIEGIITGTSGANVAFIQAVGASQADDGMMAQISSASQFIGQTVRLTGYVRNEGGSLRIINNNAMSGAMHAISPVVLDTTIASVTPLPVTLRQAETGFDGMLIAIVDPIELTRIGSTTAVDNHDIADSDTIFRFNFGAPSGVFTGVEAGMNIVIHRAHISHHNNVRQLYSTTFNEVSLIALTGITNANRIEIVEETGGGTEPGPEVISIAEAQTIPSGTVTVEGIATGVAGSTGNDLSNLFIQDGTGNRDSILVFGGAGNNLSHLIGSRIRVTGTRSAFNTMQQIQTNNANIVVLEENATIIPSPVSNVDLLFPPNFRHALISMERVQFHHRDSGVPAGVTPTGAPLATTHFILGSTGQRYEIQLAAGQELPEGLQTGDWIRINSANVQWANAVSAVRLINVDFEPTTAPILRGLQANPLSGSEVLLHSDITLATVTEGAQIRYRINGGEVQTSESNTIIVPVTEFIDGTFAIEAYVIMLDESGELVERTDTQQFNYRQVRTANIIPSHVSGRVRPDTVVSLKTATEGATIFYRFVTEIEATDATVTEGEYVVVVEEEEAGAIIAGNVVVVDEITEDMLLTSVMEGWNVYEDGITLTEEMLPVRIEAVAVADNHADSSILELDFTLRHVGGEGFFFGQLHAHTTMSDGQGTPEAAFAEARDVAGLDFFALSDHSNWFDAGYTFPGSGVRASNADGPEIFNLDTYQSTGSVNWTTGNLAAEAAARDTFVAENGFEFTWAGGPGHINTFNTDGWVGRQNSFLNTNNNDLRLQRYYDLLRRTPQSISMFNHPGTTFGNFNNFAHFDAEIAQRIPLIEVSNGEGAIGAGGFFPSHEQYIMALDRGWLVAPANSQDNHRGRFGWANEGRVAVYTNEFSEDGLWQAFRERAVYSTEIRDMEITFYMNNEPMGSVLHTIPAVAEFEATVYVPEEARVHIPGAPRDHYTITAMELVTNGGVTLERQEFNVPAGELATYNVSMNTPDAGYYFLRVHAVNSRGQARVAMTAPVWIGRAPLVGISEVTTDTFMPITDEEMTLDVHFFNDHTTDVTLRSMDIIVNGELLETKSFDDVIEVGTNKTVAYEYITSERGIQDITIRANIDVDGRLRQYDGFITLHVRYGANLDFIGIDGSHFNEYVDGGQRNSFSNFALEAADLNFRTVIFRTPEEIIEAASNPRFKMLIFAPPGRHAGILNDPTRAEHRSYSDEVVEAVAQFAKNGGRVAISGLGNFNDSPGTIPGVAGSATGNQNRLLEAMGANIRIGDASHSAPIGFREIATSAHQHDLRFRQNFNLENPFMANVVPQEYDELGLGQLYRNFSTGVLYTIHDDGTTARGTFPTNVNPMIFAHPGSWALNSNTGQASEGPEGDRRPGLQAWALNVPRYEHPQFGLAPFPGRGTGEGQRQNADEQDGQALIAASQNIGAGDVVVFSSVFFTNFDIRRQTDNVGELPNANLTIAQNMLSDIASQQTITPIADVWDAPMGTWFTIEGIATTPGQQDIDNPAENRGFINSMYIQDATGGINLFEVAQDIRIGQTVRAYGYVSEYQGERQLTVHRGGSIRVTNPAIQTVEALSLTSVGEVLNHTGRLIETQGFVSDIVLQPGTDDVLLQFTLTDPRTQDATTVFMRDYITRGVDTSHVEEGAFVRATGLASHGELAEGTGPRIRVRDRAEILATDAPIIECLPGCNCDDCYVAQGCLPGCECPDCALCPCDCDNCEGCPCDCPDCTYITSDRPARRLRDPITGVIVDAPEGAITRDTTLRVIQLPSDHPMYILAARVLGEEYARKIAFDISLRYANGFAAQPQRPVQVYIPVPEDFEVELLSKYFMDENGNLYEFELCILDGEYYVRFETDHFSIYLLAEQDNGNGNGTNNNNNNNNASPSTGDENNFVTFIVLLGVSVAVAAGAIVYKKRSEKA